MRDNTVILFYESFPLEKNDIRLDKYKLHCKHNVFVIILQRV